jgi:glucokinase
MNASYPRLLADIGGTNARWAYQATANAALTHVASYECAKFASLSAVIKHYLEAHGLTRPRALAMGVATPVTGDLVRFVNNSWSFSIEALRSELKLDRLLVLNDFAALAMSLPLLGPDDRLAVGGGEAVASAPVVVLGPGTGLGVAALITDAQGTGHSVVSGEGGHATVAAGSDREAQVLALLRRRFGHVSAERVLSGPGLVNLYGTLCELSGVPAMALQPADVLSRAQARSDARCEEALELFVNFLASEAGNLALTFGALGGVYLAGGILPRLGPLFQHDAFRMRFKDKGRFKDYLDAIPCWIVTAKHAALLGASHALDQAGVQ